jgi:hypothetical protein
MTMKYSTNTYAIRQQKMELKAYSTHAATLSSIARNAAILQAFFGGSQGLHVVHAVTHAP